MHININIYILCNELIILLPNSFMSSDNSLILNPKFVNKTKQGAGNVFKAFIVQR